MSLIISNKKIYTLRKKDIKPLVQLSEVIAFTFSKDPKNKHFIIHIKDSMDEIFYGEQMFDVLDALKYVFFMINLKNLPVY